MVDPMVLLAFVPAALALNLTPGPDMLLCLGQGLRFGPRAAIAASAGVSAGAMVHMSIAGLGLGAVIAALPWAFDVIRWLGVGYLLWLAYATIRGGHADTPEPARANPFRAGLLVNLLNPKVILFVLAFVPQFIRPEAGPVLAQFLIFGAIMAFGGFIVNGVVGAFASSIGRRMARGSGVLRYVTGALFAGLAVRLAILERA